ncbi:MAG: hypothetical protein KBG28_21060 [Kofleriaceae bacterium]|nr:hypothetical protein [Kofleriaceae bacterium]
MASVLVYIEAEGDGPTPATTRAIAAGRRLATSLGAELAGVVVVSAPPGSDGAPADPAVATHSGLAARLATGGIDKVVLATAVGPIEPRLWATVGPTLAAVCDQLRPGIVIVPAGDAADELAPRLAAHLGALLVRRGELAPAPRLTLLGRGPRPQEIDLDDLDRALVFDSSATEAAEARGDADAEILLLAVDRPGDPALRLVPAGAPLDGPTTRTEPGEGDGDRAGTLGRAVVTLALTGAGAEVVALSAMAGARDPGRWVAIAGGPDRTGALAAASAAQAGRLVDLVDDDFGERDYLGQAQVVAAAIRRTGGEVVVADDPVLAGALAELLERGLVTGVTGLGHGADGLRIDRGDRTLLAHGPVVLAWAEVVAPPAPATAASPTAPPVRESWSLADLGLDATTLRHRRRRDRPTGSPPS